MLVENFDFNTVKNTKSQDLSKIIRKEVNKQLLDECISYIQRLILSVYKGFVNVDKYINVDIDYEHMIADFILSDAIGEKFYIRLLDNYKISVYSGSHGCLDITPTVLALINDNTYTVVELGRYVSHVNGIWISHGITQCGLFINFDGCKHYVEDINYIEVSDDFIDRLKRIKIEQPDIKCTVVGIRKGWIFKNREQYDEFWDILHKAGYTDWAKYKVTQKYNLHQMQVARYEDSRHISQPQGSYYIIGEKRHAR